MHYGITILSFQPQQQVVKVITNKRFSLPAQKPIKNVPAIDKQFFTQFSPLFFSIFYIVITNEFVFIFLHLTFNQYHHMELINKYL